MYLIRLMYLDKPSKAYCSLCAKTGKVTVCLVLFLTVLLLISSGVAYRVLASRLQLIIDSPISLPVPLSAFPAQIGNWIGKNLTIPNTTKEYMERNFADDFLSRRYVNSTTKDWVDVYVVYCSSRPSGMLGHCPQVCYPGNGWIHDDTEQSQFISRANNQILCLIHRFHKPAPMYGQTVVLNFYIFNGQISTNENDFTRSLSRRPNLTLNPARYVAQVQISSVIENSIRTAAKDMTDLILDFLPDSKGHVRTTAYAENINNRHE